MTTAEIYRQLEKSPAINIARYIFNNIKTNSTNSTIGDEIIEIKTGKTPSKQNKRFYEDDYLNWFKPDEIGSEKNLYKAKDKLSKFTYENNHATIFEPDTILINAIGDVGRISILKVKASSNQQITGIRFNKNIDIDYAYFYLLANRHYFYVDLFQTTLPIVNQKKIISIPFNYPDIEEQRNIVEGLNKIDKILSIDDLDIIENLNWNDDYKKACRIFFEIQFNSKAISLELTHQLSLVKKLRQQFMQDAVQGKLLTHVPSQKESGESAIELLKKIKAEKAKLVAEKKLKKEKELPPIKPEETPFETPEGWVWCRLSDITSVLGDGLHGTPTYDTNGNFYFINGNNLKNGKIEFKENTKKVSESEYLKHGKTLNSNTVFVSINGTLGNLAFYNGEKIILGKSTCYFNLYQEIFREYIGIYIKSSYFLKYAIDVASETTIKNVSLNSMRLLPIPLPPIPVQHRIVEKLDELIKYCDGLEASIKESQVQNEKLLQQVLRESLRG